MTVDEKDLSRLSVLGLVEEFERAVGRAISLLVSSNGISQAPDEDRKEA